jgi:hypothetical protein
VSRSPSRHAIPVVNRAVENPTSTPISFIGFAFTGDNKDLWTQRDFNAQLSLLFSLAILNPAALHHSNSKYF